MTKNIVFGTPGTKRLRIDLNGNVAISTKAPDAKLSENGTVHAQQIKVTRNGWSDYVFDSSYTLSPISRLRKHPTLNHRLTKVPSASEIGKN